MQSSVKKQHGKNHDLVLINSMIFAVCYGLNYFHFIVSLFLKITLTSPEGEIFTNDSSEAVRYSVDTNLNITYIRILSTAQVKTTLCQIF